MVGYALVAAALHTSLEVLSLEEPPFSIGAPFFKGAPLSLWEPLFLYGSPLSLWEPLFLYGSPLSLWEPSFFMGAPLSLSPPLP